MSGPRVLVLGAGSAGRRHLRNLAALGATVSAMDPRGDRLAQAGDEVQLAAAHDSLAGALADPLDAVVVASPPRFHVDHAIAALDRRLPVLLEKPPSADLASTSRLADAQRRAGVPLLLGYTYRWWPPLREFRRRLRTDFDERPLSVRCVMSAHLADWHPWEAYTDFYMASSELGGGALLDESHVIDLMLWMFGMPDEVFGRVERLSGLDIDTDDHVDLWLRYASGPRVQIHLDLYGRPHRRSIEAVGEGATLEWAFEQNRIRHSRDAQGGWDEQRFDCERNDMFLSLAREFLDVLDGASPSCTMDDAVAVMRVIEAARESSTRGTAVRPG